MPLPCETKGILRLLRGVLSIHLLAVIAQATFREWHGLVVA
jgi:hypothetical protein